MNACVAECVLEYENMGSDLIVSAVVMEAVLREKGLLIHPAACWRSMIDTAATVTLVPPDCTHHLGLSILPHTDERRIGTADQKGSLEIQGLG